MLNNEAHGYSVAKFYPISTEKLGNDHAPRRDQIVFPLPTPQADTA
jgi:hypothetical protein